MRRPTLAHAVAFNHAVRQPDEWFEEADDLARVRRALAAIEAVEDPIAAAAVLAYRISNSQGFAEGNKRTAVLLARWVLDRNGLKGVAILPPDDRVFADLLVKAASGDDVEADMIAVLKDRAAV